MREERGRVTGELTVEEPYTLWGSVHGDVRVVEGGKMYVRGNIYGDLMVEFGGRVHVFGHVSGDMTVRRGAKVIHSGTVAGNVTNDGGRLFVEACSSILGKLKTLRGETHEEPKDDGFEQIIS